MEIKKTIYFPNIYQAKSVYHDGRWMTFSEWSELSRPTLDVKRKINFVVASKYFHKNTSGVYSYYLIEMTEYDNVSIITDFHYLGLCPPYDYNQPYKKDVKEFVATNVFLRNLPKQNIYYITNVETHDAMLKKIGLILNNRSHLTPINR